MPLCPRGSRPSPHLLTTGSHLSVVVLNFPFSDFTQREGRIQANYGNPTTALNSSNFGRILTAGDPRIMQFGMKMKF